MPDPTPEEIADKIIEEAAKDLPEVLKAREIERETDTPNLFENGSTEKPKRNRRKP